MYRPKHTRPIEHNPHHELASNLIESRRLIHIWFQFANSIRATFPLHTCVANGNQMMKRTDGRLWGFAAALLHMCRWLECIRLCNKRGWSVRDAQRKRFLSLKPSARSEGRMQPSHATRTNCAVGLGLKKVGSNLTPFQGFRPIFSRKE